MAGVPFLMPFVCQYPSRKKIILQSFFTKYSHCLVIIMIKALNMRSMGGSSVSLSKGLLNETVLCSGIIRTPERRDTEDAQIY